MKRSLNDMKLCRKAGFTLLELILVTLLLLTLIGLSIPVFKKTFLGLSAKDAAFNISKLMNYAQEISVLERKNFTISFDFQNGKYRLMELDTSGKEPAYRRTSGRFARIYGLPQGVSLKGEKRYMVFYPDGHCDPFKVYVLIKGGGYSLTAKRFGNIVDIKEVGSD